MSSLTPWWLPVAVSTIASFGVLVAAVLTARAAAERDRESRRALHESERLAELLDTALAFRAVLARVSRTLEYDESLIVEYRREEATFRARREAVVSRRVRRLAAHWHEASRVALTGGTAVPPGSERAVWDAFVAEIGAARRRTVYRGRRRS